MNLFHHIACSIITEDCPVFSLVLDGFTSECDVVIKDGEVHVTISVELEYYNKDVNETALLHMYRMKLYTWDHVPRLVNTRTEVQHTPSYASVVIQVHAQIS